jgi:non-ribosomal peptide synthase protein (TIGR01720 family)
VQAFEPVRLGPEGDPPRRRGGVYLLTGGLGGVGLELAGYLARAGEARLVLVGRSELPPREEWDARLARDLGDTATGRRIRKIRSLEALGAVVVVERADVSERAEMEAVVRRTEERFGRIHGVVHAAGMAPGGVIQLATRETAAAVMAAKVKGTAILCDLLRDRPPDFLVLCSSLASVIGLPGQADYAAANAFMDAMARRNAAPGRPFTVSINWDTWAEVGMSANAIREAGGPLRPSPLGSLHPREGAEAFGRVLSLGQPQVVTSVVDLAPRLIGSSTPEPFSAPKRRAAPTDEPTPAGEPSTEVERVLVDVFRSLLGIDRVSLDDNFFELGGDSLTALQAVGILKRRLGRDVRVVMFYEAPTVGLLARALAPPSDGPTALEGAEERADTRRELLQRRRHRPAGPVPLVPIQRWFFEQGLADAHHFNQAILLEVRAPLDSALLERALREVVRRHDALRLRYATLGGQVTAEGLAEPVLLLTRLDLSDRSEAELDAALQAGANELQGSLRPAEGRLVGAAYFHLGNGRTARLLLVVHHLAVDAMSWPVLLEDLATAYGQLLAGRPLQLSATTTPFAEWARALAGLSRSEAVGREAGFWLGLPWDRVRPLPVDRPGGSNTAASVRFVYSALDLEHTHALLRELPGRLRAKVDEILLAALAGTVRGLTGGALLVDLEAHGREAVEGTDVSRTVGWFTSLVPVLLDFDSARGLVPALRTARDQLRAIPARGFNYGLLRYLRGDEALAGRLAALPQSEMSFLYMGRFEPAATAGLFGAAPEPAGELRSPRGRRRHLLELVASVSGGQLRVLWMFSEALHDRSTVEAWAESYLAGLRALVRESREHDEERVGSGVRPTRDVGPEEAFDAASE